MFKLGEYNENEARSIAGYLKDAGFKVDIKGFVQATTDITVYIQGKQSEIKEKIENFEGYERFLAAFKAVVEKASNFEDFRDLFLTELEPNWKDREEKLRAAEESPEEMDEETRLDTIGFMAELVVSIDFAEKIMELNDIKLGEPIGNRLDDPLISVPANPDDYDPDDPNLKERVDIDLEEIFEVSTDEIYAPLFRKIDEEFEEKYYDEYMQLMALGLLMEDLIEEPSKGKIEMEDFRERCYLDIGEGDILSINAGSAAEEIARSLEKNGMIKRKGNMIKWKA